MNTADLVDRHPDAVSACQLQFTWLGRKASFHGPIATPLRIELAKSNEGLQLVFSAKAPF